jgi:hypothetical protein
MATDDQSMTEAMEAWITARERFLADRKGGMDAYFAALRRIQGKVDFRCESAVCEQTT